MSRSAVALLAIALALAPVLAALPDEPFWSSWLCACVLLAALLTSLHRKAAAPPFAGEEPTPASQSLSAPSPEGKGEESVPERSLTPPLLGAGGPLAPSPLGRGSAFLSRGVGSYGGRLFLALLCWAALSLAVRLGRQHSLAFLGVMERGGMLLAANFALFVLTQRAARLSRGRLYALVGAIVGAGAIVSALGVNEWVAHVRVGEAGWRIFGTSTPDFLGGYLALLVPLTLALFLGAPAGRPLALLLGLLAALETVALLATQSRFGLVSLAAALVVFGASLARARRAGFALPSTVRRRLLGMAVVVLLLGLAAARPVLARLQATGTGDNSTAFRVWTWRGAARMAEANPVFGTGIGAWVDDYPRYAQVGFTRLAHNSYLQMADECGVPGLLLLLATLGSVGVSGARGLRRPLLPDEPDTLAEIAPPDDRLLLCGLLASLTAGITQNAIDSDWYVFFLGLTFWGLAGLTVGTAGRGERSPEMAPPETEPRSLKLAAGAAAALLAFAFAAQGMGAWYANRARAASTAALAELNYRLAQAWEPFNAAYPADLGYRVYARQGRLDEAAAALQAAVQREPSGVNFRRLGAVLAAQGQIDAARAAYQNGLRADPLSLDLLLGAAQLSLPPEALAYYARMAQLEQSPVGQVRAIGEMAETRFAVADTALGDAAAAGNAKNAKQAAADYARARALLEAYADEGGTTNPQRQALLGGRRDLRMDAQMRALYAHVMAGLMQSAPANQQSSLQKARANYDSKFARVLAAP